MAAQQAATKQSWSDKYLTVQTVAGMLSFVFGAGLLYGEFKGMKSKDIELESRQQRQFELYTKLNSEVMALKEASAYEKGFRDGQKNTK